MHFVILRRRLLKLHLHGIRSIETSNVKYVHRQVVSRMFPSVELGSKRTHDQQTETDKVGCLSHKLMVQQRLIQGASLGTFYLLPSLTRALEKLHRIIDQEMYSIGAQKIAMPCLAPRNIWQLSGRWDKMGSELFTLRDRIDGEHCLAPTHEEAVTSVVAAEPLLSYKRLPVRLYQIGRKFRDERRPKHGLLRCREFEMKDLYTFDADAEGAERTYNEVCEAYSRLLNRLELPYVVVEASSGAMGGTKSQEFDLLSPVGEDFLLSCRQCGKTFNKEILSSDKPAGCVESHCSKDFEEKSGIEVAHAFILGTLYSEVLNASFVGQNQKKSPLFMDCFGIGVTRLLAAAVEVLSSATELRWPRLLAPYQICIIPQKEGYKSEVTKALADSLYDELANRYPHLQYEMVIDDRLHLSIGERVVQAKVSGYPHIVVLGKQALLSSPLFEHIDVYNNNVVEHVSPAYLVDRFREIQTVRIV